MRYQIRRIVVATNFSAEAENAMDYAVTLAKEYKTGLDIIHAVAPSRTGKGQLVSAAYEKLKKYKDDISRQHGVEVKVFARMSEATDFIYKYVVDNRTDLLIIGVKRGVKKYFGESKAYEIIMKIECPVLSIPFNFKKEHFSYVLFPVRDVAGVKEKLLYSKPFIEKDHAKLHLICFSQPGPQRIEELIEAANREGITSVTTDFGITSAKNVAPHVISAAKERHDDLIVINATSEKEWYKIFGENYTEYILKESDIAVLSITHPFESAGEWDEPDQKS